MGSTPELGVWKEAKCTLTWTKGDIWKLLEPLQVSKSYFKYKYVVVQDSQISRWESGIDRIADCAILPDISPEPKHNVGLMGSDDAPMYFNEQTACCSHDSKPKIVEVNDTWEQMMIKFTVFTSDEDLWHDQVVLNKDGK